LENILIKIRRRDSSVHSGRGFYERPDCWLF